ncbi:MAG: hypothetical protein COY68_03995 [Candidatus Levybacteria bacterium CG_4_10_14_0_8_um_filter_35_23]|nr:MAG: hypothetical protein COY68_03995 [Candidatus Levybacteria bacterium CG_4_10_14_0_8_um_filter_35_23]
MDETKRQLTGLLTAINFEDSKEEFIDEFLDLVNKETMSLLVSSKIPVNKLEKIKNISSEQQSDEWLRLIKEYIGTNQYNEVYESVFSSNLKSALSNALPKLNDKQTAIFNAYLSQFLTTK